MEDDLASTVADVARRLHVSKSLIYGLIRSGQIPAVSLGRRVLVPRPTVERLARFGLTPPTRSDDIIRCVGGPNKDLDGALMDETTS